MSSVLDRTYDEVYAPIEKGVCKILKNKLKHEKIYSKYQQYDATKTSPPDLKQKHSPCQFSHELREVFAKEMEDDGKQEVEALEKFKATVVGIRLAAYKRTSEFYANEWFPFSTRDGAATEHIRLYIAAHAPPSLPEEMCDYWATALQLKIDRWLDSAEADELNAEAPADGAMDTAQAPAAVPPPTMAQLCERLHNLELQLQQAAAQGNGRGSAEHRGRHGSAQPNAATDTNDRQRPNRNQERRAPSDSAARSQSSAHSHRRSPSRAAPRGSNGTRDPESRSHHHHRRQHHGRSQSRDRERGRPRNNPSDRDHHTNRSRERNQRNRDRERRSRSQPRRDDSRSRKDSSRRR